MLCYDQRPGWARVSVEAGVYAFCVEHMGEPGSVSIGTYIIKASAILVGTNWVLCGHFQTKKTETKLATVAQLMEM